MNDNSNNNQSGHVRSTDEVQANSCTDCKKNPCACTTSKVASSKEKPPRTTPPKISWI